MVTKKIKKISLKAKLLLALGAFLIVILTGIGISYYLNYFKPNVNGNIEYLYINTGSDFNDVYLSIKSDAIVNDTVAFYNAAQNMEYVGKVKAGRYRLTKGMSNRAFINMLKAGNQEPVKVSFQNVRLKHTLAGMVSKKIETDSASISTLLDSTEFVKKYGFTTDNVYTMFIPNSYEIYWNTDAEKFFNRMHEEYVK